MGTISGQSHRGRRSHGFAEPADGFEDVRRGGRGAEAADRNGRNESEGARADDYRAVEDAHLSTGVARSGEEPAQGRGVFRREPGGAGDATVSRDRSPAATEVAHPPREL